MAAILMIVNVAIFLWASGRQVSIEDVATSAKPVVNMEGMLLLNEVNNSNQFGTITDSQKPELEESDTKNSEAGESDLILTEDQVQQEEIDGQNAEQRVPNSLVDVKICNRVGPFRKLPSWQSATDWMAKQNFVFEHVTSESRGLRAVRVFLGPFDSRAATTQYVQSLKSRNLDYFIYTDDTGEIRISLGYFTQEALAAKFLAYLSSIDVSAKSEPEYRQLGPFNWMVTAVSESDLLLLIDHEWIEPGVELTRVDC